MEHKAKTWSLILRPLKQIKATREWFSSELGKKLIELEAEDAFAKNLSKSS